MTITPAVQLDKVALTLGTRAFDFDCALSPGKVTAITGPSGSGKSTLLNLVAGFETPDSGRIWLEGRNVTASIRANGRCHWSSRTTTCLPTSTSSPMSGSVCTLGSS